MRTSFLAVALGGAVLACGGESDDSSTSTGAPGNGSGGEPSAGGASSGGSSTDGGSSTGGSAQGGATGGGAAGRPSGGRGGAATAGCESIDQELAQFKADSRACRTDGDCTAVYGDCLPITDFCDGSIYLSADYDSVRFSRMMDHWRVCNGDIDCAACDAIAPPPACNNGECGMSTP